MAQALRDFERLDSGDLLLLSDGGNSRTGTEHTPSGNGSTERRAWPPEAPSLSNLI